MWGYMVDVIEAMSPPKRATSSHDLRTKRILSAAERLFLVHGFDGASMDDIAFDAGVSKRTVYNRYVSKEELFDEVAFGACESIFNFNFNECISLPAQDYLLNFAEALLRMRLSPQSILLQRNISFRSHRTESLASGYESFGTKPIIEMLSNYLKDKTQQLNGTMMDETEAAWTLFTLVREPLESKIIMLAFEPENLDEAIEKQAHRGVTKFLTLYPHFAQNQAPTQ